MRRLIIGLAFALAAEAAALACSCAIPENAAEARKFAREVVRGASAVVEVEVLTDFDEKSRAGEQVRVRRVLAGRAPTTFRIDRGGGRPSSAACHLELTRGQRRILIVYPGSKGWFGARQYRTHGLCSDSLVRDSRFLAVTVEEARRRL